MKKTMKKILSHVIALSLVVANAITLTALPSYAEETETDSVIEVTMKPTNYAFAGKLSGLAASANRTLVNTSVITREGRGSTFELFQEGYGIYLYELYYYPSFEISDAYAVTNIKLNVERTCANQTYMRTNYAVSDEFILEGTAAGEYYDSEESDLYETLISYNTKNSTVMPRWLDYTYGDDSLWVVDISDKVLSEIKTTEETSGKAVLNLALSAYGKLSINAGEVSLTVTYDESKILEKFQSELANASTGDAVKAVVEDFDSFMDVDTDILSNMDYVYADIAKTTATTVYTFESLAEAIENRAKAYIKEITILPDNYALRNMYDGSWKTGIAVNTNILLRSDGQLRELTAINLKLWRYLSAYNLENTNAIRKMSLNTSFGSVGSWVNFFGTPVSSFPVSTEPAFYGTDAPEHTTLTSYIEKDLVANVDDGSVYANTVASIDYSGKIEALNTVAGEGNSAVLLAGVSSEIGGGGAQVKLFEDFLKVTYDMTAVYDNYNADFAAIENAADVKALVENYNDFIGANLSQVKNMDVIYAELFENISKGTVYSFDTLKAAIDDIASKCIYVVEYDKPTDYYIYKMNGKMDGAYNENLMLVNTDYMHVTENNNNYNQYKKYSYASGWLDSYFVAPILSYDIYNPQAIVDVKFTTSARRRSANDVYAGTTDYKTPIAWNVSDEDLTDAKAGRYFDDAESTTDVFDTLKAWYNANKDSNLTWYQVPTGEEFTADNKATTTTIMDIPEACMTQVQEKTAPTNLVITFNQQKRHFTAGYDSHKLTITYDLSMANETDKEFVVNGYNKYTTSEDALSLVDDGARVELVQMKKDVPSTSKAIIALYNGGVLVKTGIADVTAPGFMKKTVLDLTGFSGVTYDEIKVMTWNGVSEMKPLADSFEIR